MNRLSHYDDDATIPYNNENRNSLRPISSFKGYRETSRASGTRKDTREQGARKKVRTLRFPRPSRLHRALARSLTTRNEEVAPSRYFLVVVRVRYWVSQFTLEIPSKNSSYLHTKQRPLWLHVSYYTHLTQPLTMNNIAALTRA